MVVRPIKILVVILNYTFLTLKKNPGVMVGAAGGNFGVLRCLKFKIPGVTGSKLYPTKHFLQKSVFFSSKSSSSKMVVRPIKNFGKFIIIFDTELTCTWTLL